MSKNLLTKKQKVSVAVCGSNASGLPAEFNTKAFEIGQELAKAGCTLFSGVTTGFSLEAIKGARQQGTTIIGVSPAVSAQEHMERNEQVDLDLWDHIIFSGLGYKMRDVLMIRSVDAAIYIGGGVGTLLEMSAAPDHHVVMGVLKGSKGATEAIDLIKTISHRNKPVVVEEADPRVLVKKIIDEVNKHKE